MLFYLIAGAIGFLVNGLTGIATFILFAFAIHVVLFVISWMIGE
jgi:uncharacterized membrane protein YtjA (UPF0391 family)